MQHPSHLVLLQHPAVPYDVAQCFIWQQEFLADMLYCICMQPMGDTSLCFEAEAGNG